MEFRKLQKSDYYLYYLSLLQQLTVIGDVTQEDFLKTVDYVNSNPNHLIFVLELDGKIVASGTLLIEPKFIHNLGKVGHIEDIVIDVNYRHKKIGKLLIDHLTKTAFENGCYKVILDCSESIIPFYRSCGYTQRQVQMSIYK